MPSNRPAGRKPAGKQSSDTSQHPDRILAVRLFLLACGLFVFLAAELFPVGVMPVMAADLHRSESSIGQLVTWYAVGVGLTSIPVAVLTQRLHRRTVVVGSLLLLATSMAVSAVADNLPLIAVARLLGAVAHGAIFAVVPVAASALGRRGAEAKAVTSAFLGASVGVVAGPPLVALLSQHLGWRVASAAIGVLALVVALASARYLPALPTQNRTKLSFRLPRSMRLPLATLCFVTALIVMAHNAAYAFIAPIMADRGVSGTPYAVVLFAYGAAGALTTAFAGRYLDIHPTRVMTTGLACMALGLAALGLIDGSLPAAVATMIWGGAFGVLPAALQTRVLAVSPGHHEAATPLYLVAFQFGISVGAYLGSVLVLHLDATRLPLIAAGATAIAIPALLAGIRER